MKSLRFVLLLLLICTLAVVLNYIAIPNNNTAATHFDTLIVLGYPANPDGGPSLEQRRRVMEAVREYKAGAATYLIMTGGAAHNQFVEAHVMATLAESQGIPATAIIEETQAQNTIQNIYYSALLMQEHRWVSAEIISSRSHLPRASMILSTFDRLQPSLAIKWRTHAAPWSKEDNFLRIALVYAAEAGYCLRLRVFGFPVSRFLPSGQKLR